MCGGFAGSAPTQGDRERAGSFSAPTRMRQPTVSGCMCGGFGSAPTQGDPAVGQRKCYHCVLKMKGRRSCCCRRFRSFSPLSWLKSVRRRRGGKMIEANAKIDLGGGARRGGRTVSIRQCVRTYCRGSGGTMAPSPWRPWRAPRATPSHHGAPPFLSPAQLFHDQSFVVPLSLYPHMHCRST